MTKHLNLIDKAFILKKTPLFGGLDLDYLLTISDKMEATPYKKGVKIFSFGQESAKMYLIVEGRVELQGKDKKPFAELPPGEFFGDEGLISEKLRSYEATALEDTLLLTLSRSHFLGIISECPSVALELLEAYASYTEFRKRTLI